MRLYFAGMERGAFMNSDLLNEIKRALRKTGVKYGLTSYYYIQDQPDYLDQFDYLKSIFLDSGAFSAYNSKAKIELKDYIEFVKTHGKRVDIYANLDVIGDAAGTLKNQEEMEKEGLKPIPAFHMGEDFKFLQHYIDAGYKMIGLGGLVGKRAFRYRASFLKKCFEVIPENIKVHGFGMTSPKLLKLFPWYSADSINWIMGEMRGVLYQYDRGTIKKLDINKKNLAGTGQYIISDRWNIIQWKKYADYLDGVGRWKETKTI